MVSKFFRCMVSLAIAAVLLPSIASMQAASAQGNVSQIRDAEIENTIRAYAMPIFKAARLDSDAVQVILVNDPSINAFVAGGQKLFIFTGLLMKATSAGQVIGVIAHESGHIAGGHLARLREQLEAATIEFIIEQILTVAAAGAASTKGGGIGGGHNSGPSAGIAERELLRYSRTQESSADQAATVFLDRAGISTRGLLTFSEFLLQRERVQGLRLDPYLLTHPLTQDRVAFLQHHVEVSRFSDVPVSPQLEIMHQRMVAKLFGFVDPAQAFRKYPASDTSLPGRYARAIAYYRSGDAKSGLAILDGLIRENPNDPYFYELRGQILFENQRIAESVPAYEKAVALLPSSNLIKIGLAQSLLELNDATRTQQALKLLNGVGQEERDTAYWRLMAIGYDRIGNVGMRLLAQAELSYARGGRTEALQNARRAMQALPQGSPGWQRAQDIEFLAQKKNR